MLKMTLLVAATSLIATGALAQDADTTNWSGPYAGIHVGYGFDDGKPIDNVGNTPNNALALGTGIRPSQISQNRAGALGGGQLGYNWQRGNIIFGAEGDFSYMHQRGESTYLSPSQVLTFPAGRRLYTQSDLDWMGSARGRLGYSLGRGMIYATGGYAFGRVKGSAEFDGDTNAVVNYAGSHKYTAQGWIAGGGMEFRPFTQGAMRRVSLGIEATYYDLGKSHIYALQQNTQPGYYTLGVETRGYNGAFKINYAF